MRRRTLAFAAVVVMLASAVQYGQTRQPGGSGSGYLTPPKVVVDMLDAPPTPNVSISPDGRTVALLSRRSMPALSDLAQPIHRIAGARINPKTNGRQQRGGGVTAITLKSIADGTEKRVAVPPAANIGGREFLSRREATLLHSHEGERHRALGRRHRDGTFETR